MRRHLYDVFITHSYEDHSEFVHELVLGLKKNGFRVWYLSAELKLKTSVTTSITNALKRSRYGIVMLSPQYLSKNWAMKELGTLLVDGKIQNRILLVLCQVPVKILKEKKSPLADKYTISSRRGINQVLSKLLDILAKEPAGNKTSQRKKDGQDERDRGDDLRAQNVGVIVLGGGS